MKKFTKLLFVTTLLFVVSVIGVFASSNSIKLQLDGKTIGVTTPPAVVEQRTLIPVRSLFEAMGGQVDWNEANSDKVTISFNGINVNLTLNSKVANVNGTSKNMEVPAMIINGSTMIPVRFVGEELGCFVDWNQEKQMVIVESPTYFEQNVAHITSVALEDNGSAYRIAITGDKPMPSRSSFPLNEPKRFVLDISYGKLVDGFTPNNGSNDVIKSVRVSQFEKSKVRVVADLSGSFEGAVTTSSDQKTIYIDFKKPVNKNTAAMTSADGLPMIDWRIAQSLIVIDPGHGGSDSGSVGKENGAAVLYEKDINLDIAIRLNAMLQNAGASTYMTRSEDNAVSLYDRPNKANALGAELLIGVHNNSATSTSANGVEVLYFSKESEANYDISSKRLAQVAQQELLKELGVNDRGIKERPGLAVLRLSNMPAIIVEGAFISNGQDLAYMKTAEFRERYAKAVARATIQVLNETASTY